jgi:hypothetical protein
LTPHSHDNVRRGYALYVYQATARKKIHQKLLEFDGFRAGFYGFEFEIKAHRDDGQDKIRHN